MGLVALPAEYALCLAVDNPQTLPLLSPQYGLPLRDSEGNFQLYLRDLTAAGPSPVITLREALWTPIAPIGQYAWKLQPDTSEPPPEPSFQVARLLPWTSFDGGLQPFLENIDPGILEQEVLQPKPLPVELWGERWQIAYGASSETTTEST
ncbi:hypothetical protein WJX72_002331 [[Myrmecia] bisecta]|uniref:Uncharacterized protein n=1 Tax=[Myrmecia] bisecta TaxID=41462 RepID=A0AAW1P518_9CHLO